MKQLILLFLLMAFACQTTAQWAQVNGPKDPFSVVDMVKADSMLLIATAHGSFFSCNEGGNWQPLIPEVFYYSVVFHDTVYTAGERYPGYGQAMVRRMIFENGAWTGLGLYENSGPVHGMFADESNIFAAFQNDGFNPSVAGFVWSDNGYQWQSYNTGLPKDSINLFGHIFYVYNLFALDAGQTFIYVGTRKGVYRSPRSPFQWSPANSGLPENSQVDAIVCRDNIVFAAIGNVLYRSLDDGDTWMANHTFSEGNTINRLQKHGNDFYAMTQTEGLQATSDDGLTWMPVNTGLDNLKTYCLAEMEDVFYLGHGSGISKGMDNWQRCDTGIVCSNVRDMAQTGLAMAAVEFNRVFISPDEGHSWENRSPFEEEPDYYIWSIVGADNCLLFSLRKEFHSECITYRSCDNGDSWFPVAPLFSDDDVFTLRSNGSMVAAYANSDLFITTNLAQTWVEQSPGGSIADVLFEGNHLYTTTDYTDRVLHSADTGRTWNLCNQGLGGAHIYKLGAGPDAVYALSNTAMFRTQDQGQTWQECAPLGEDIRDFACFADLIFTCNNNEVFGSRDHGASWTNISQGLPPLPDLWGGSLMVRDGYLYFGTYMFGIWRIYIPDIPVYATQTTFDPVSGIFQNPVNDKITFLPEVAGSIEHVAIFDLSGRIVLGRKKPGNPLDVTFLSEGAYFIAVTTTKRGIICYKMIKQ